MNTDMLTTILGALAAVGQIAATLAQTVDVADGDFWLGLAKAALYGAFGYLTNKR
jgi:hypothetical protein